MKKMLRCLIRGTVSVSMMLVMMLAPVAAIEYASELMTKPQHGMVGEYTLKNYDNSQQMVSRWLDKFDGL